MKKIFSLLFAFILFGTGQLMAQTEENADGQEKGISQVEIKDKGDKKKVKAEERGSSNVYTNEAPKPTSPYANKDIGGFTVTKFKESKTTKKLRRGEARSRMSVPDPKGKPLKHKKKHKFKLFS